MTAAISKDDCLPPSDITVSHGNDKANPCGGIIPHTAAQTWKNLNATHTFIYVAGHCKQHPMTNCIF